MQFSSARCFKPLSFKRLISACRTTTISMTWKGQKPVVQFSYKFVPRVSLLFVKSCTEKGCYYKQVDVFKLKQQPRLFQIRLFLLCFGKITITSLREFILYLHLSTIQAHFVLRSRLPPTDLLTNVQHHCHQKCNKILVIVPSSRLNNSSTSSVVKMILIKGNCRSTYIYTPPTFPSYRV